MMDNTYLGINNSIQFSYMSMTNEHMKTIKMLPNQHKHNGIFQKNRAALQKLTTTILMMKRKINGLNFTLIKI